MDNVKIDLDEDSFASMLIKELQDGFKNIVKEFIVDFALNSLSRSLNVEGSRLLRSKAKAVQELKVGSQKIFDDIATDDAFKTFIKKINEVFIASSECKTEVSASALRQLSDTSSMTTGLLNDMVSDIKGIKNILESQTIHQQESSEEDE